MTKNYSAHIFSLCALFILSNAVTKYSLSTTGLMPLLVFIAISFALVFLSIFLINLVQNNKKAFFVLNLIVLLAASSGAIFTFLDFFAFIKMVLLPQSNHVLLLAASLLIVFLFSVSHTEAILKYSLFTAVICVLVIIVCFVLSIKNFDFSAFTNSSNQRIYLGEVITNFSVVSLTFFAKDKSHNTKPILWGSFTGFLLVTLCALQSLLVFGKTDNITFSYLNAVGTISTGSLFSRLDGLVYFLFFVTSIIKITVCVKVFLKSTIFCLKNAIETSNTLCYTLKSKR